jgi:DNA-binding response OmpR family regulator
MPYDCANLQRVRPRRSAIPKGRPSERILELERQLSEAQARIVALESLCRLNELELAPVLPQWTTALSGSELGAMLAMFRAFPQPLDAYALDEVVPRYDHVAERDVRGMSVLIHKLRKKIGADAVVNVWGRGYTLSDAFHARLKAELGPSPRMA